ncbi:MAG: SDR family NAD(P)-dependent oxidoreductase [Burkholderiaceae bacterium]
MLAPDQRVIMISGASRGIGLACARELARLGYRLSLGVRSPDAVDRSGLGDDLLVCHWDALDKASAAAWTNATHDHFGRIDGLVLNAGILNKVGLEDDDDEALDAMWNVNVKGPLALVRAALPALRASGHGRVITLASLAGKRVLSPASFGYSASKFAAMALSHALRQAGWADGVRGTAICPGLVETDMTAGVTPPAGQFMIQPETIAATVAYALSLPNEAAVAEILVNSRLEFAQ